MRRYENTKIIRPMLDGKPGARVYGQSLPPTYAPDPRDTYFYAKSSDRLDLLANEFYGDVTLWPIIATANNLGKGTFAITAGKLIRIPYKRDFKF
jgi:nucleoid-associated protein YgaU